MPFDVKIQNTTVIARYHGVVTFDEVLEASGVSWGDPVWDKTESYITDFSDADSLEMTPEQATALAYMDNASINEGVGKRKYAFVVSNPQIIGLIQTFVQSLNAPDWEIRFFDSMEGAVDWTASDD